MFFKPKRVFFEQDALKYPLGEKLYREFKQQAVEIKLIGSHNRVTGIPGKTPREAYREGKNTMVVGVRRTLKFESCKPSAHYQLPLATSCAGMCEYCYLNTTLGKKPYLRIYVNIEEILNQAKKYIEERKPEITFFEGAATSDPIPVEKYSGSLKKTIHFFGTQEYGRFRFVTKFTDVDSLMNVDHNKHTRFRFSVNTDDIIKRYEHRTPSLSQRVEAAGKVAKSGYPLGFIIAPIIIYPNWRREYLDLLQKLKNILSNGCEKELTFELITHRFTARAKNNILDIYPDTELPMIEEERKFKYGQFGYGKYVYPKEQMAEVKAFFTERIAEYFPKSKIDYLV
ncbi:spore photoproduct lyase [Desulfolucanica intricata]|uniref:spore photoproduct lyase n=1 Tax=Desulfolucanica intricata TaxID=1285191 RepID=UPI00082BD9E1|nr:spore photoproduct lyase [Desulfolucanica intricata]